MLDSIYHMTLKYLNSHFWHENTKIFSSFMQCYNGCYNVNLTKSVNHQWFINFIAWHYNTFRHGVM